MKKTKESEGAQVSNKTLVKLGEERVAWLRSIIELSEGKTSQTEILKLLIDQARVVDPETFMAKLGKLKLKAKLDEIERKEKELQAEKDKLTSQIEGGVMLDETETISDGHSGRRK